MRRLTAMGFSVATLFLLLIMAVVLQNIASATAAASLTIGSNYSLVSSKRISSTVYEYVYRAQLTNSGVAANNVAATLTSTPQGVTIVKGNLSFGNVAAGAVVSSSDTFTVRHDRQYPFNANALVWSVFSDVILYGNPGNPLLLSYRQSNGDTATLFGTKGNDGLATSLEGVYFKNPNGTPSSLWMDAQGRPAKALLEDGSVLTFTWNSESQFQLSIMTKEGTQAVVSLDSNQVTSSPSIRSAIDVKQLSHSGINVAKTVQDLAAPPLDYVNTLVTQEGNPVADAQVSLTFLPQGADQLSCIGNSCNGYSVIGYTDQDGKWSTSYVSNPTKLLTSLLVDACNIIVNDSVTYCKWMTSGDFSRYMTTIGCLQAGAALELASVGTATLAVPEMIAACEVFFAATTTGCSPLNKSSLSSGPVCSGIGSIADFFSPDGVKIKAVATKAGQSVSKEVTVPSTTGPVEITLDLPKYVYEGPMIITWVTTDNISHCVWNHISEGIVTISFSSHGEFGMFDFSGNLKCSTQGRCACGNTPEKLTRRIPLTGNWKSFSGSLPFGGIVIGDSSDSNFVLVNYSAEYFGQSQPDFQVHELSGLTQLPRKQ